MKMSADTDISYMDMLKIDAGREIKTVERIISWKKKKWLELTDSAANEGEINLSVAFSKHGCQGIFPRSDRNDRFCGQQHWGAGSAHYWLLPQSLSDKPSLA